MAYIGQSRSTRASRYALLVLILVLGGCTASIEAYPERPYDNTVPVLPQIDSVRVAQEFYQRKTEDDRQNYRNELIAERTAAINASYRLFEERLFQEGTVRNIASDWALLGLAGAGATVSSSATQQILAAISGGLVGARAAFDKNALFDRALPALVAKMQATRQQVELRLLAGMKLDTTDYGIIEALGDLDSYYAAGTLPGAILDVAGDAGVVKTQVQRQRTYSYKSLDDSAKALLQAISTANGIDAAKVKQLRTTCFATLGLPSDVLLVDFLYGGEFVVERTKALACMRSLPAAPAPQMPMRPAPLAGRPVAGGGPVTGRPVAGGGPAPTTVPPLDASKLTDQLETLLKDPATGLATKDRVDLVRSCYPRTLSPSTLPGQLLNDRLGFAKEKREIIDCVAAAKADTTLDPAKLSDELADLLKDPATGLATKSRVDRALSCYPPGFSHSMQLDQLLDNRSGFAKEKKAIIDCMKKT